MRRTSWPPSTRQSRAHTSPRRTQFPDLVRRVAGGAILLAGSLALATCLTMTAQEIENYLLTRRYEACPVPGCSPLIGLGSVIQQAASENGLDPRLLLALAGVESGYGSKGCQGSLTNFNAFGWLRSGLCQNFASWADGIREVAAGLRRAYIARGLKSLREIYQQGYCTENCSTDTLERIYQKQLGGNVDDVTSDCPNVCGNGRTEPGEECDSPDEGACPGQCNSTCRCSVCGNNVIEAGEECDGTTPHVACPTQDCRSNCTIDCGTCGACISNVCSDITPSPFSPRWAIMIQHDSSTQCGCNPPTCVCSAGAAMTFGYYNCSGSNLLGCCDALSQGSSNPAGSCNDTPCLEKTHLANVWQQLLACPPSDCTGAPCLPPEARDENPQQPPELGKKYDLRTKKEKDAGCLCFEPPPCLSPACCAG